MNNYLEVDVKDVKRFNSYTDGTTVHFEADPEGAWVDADDYDAALSNLAAETLRADTAEAELEALRTSLEAVTLNLKRADDLIGTRTADLLACGTRRKAAEQRVSELLVMLRQAWVDTEVSAQDCRKIDAALNPKPEAVCRDHNYHLGECTKCGCISPTE